MKVYEHKHNAGRKVEAVQVTENNTDAVAEWCGGEADDVSVNVLIEGGNATKVADKGDYVILDSAYNFHVRNATVFETKYKLSESQDEEIDFDNKPSTIGEANVWSGVTDYDGGPADDSPVAVAENE